MSLHLLSCLRLNDLDRNQQHDGHEAERQRDDVALGVLVLVERSEDVQRRGLRLSGDAPLTISTAPISPIDRAVDSAIP